MESSKKQKMDEVKTFLEVSFKEMVPKDGLLVVPERLTFIGNQKEIQEIVHYATYAWTVAELPRKYIYNCGCGLKFQTYGYLLKHFLVCEDIHIPSNLKNMFLERFSYPFPKEWERVISGCIWKPIDVDAAVLERTEIMDWDDQSLQSKDPDRTLYLERIGGLLETLMSKKLLDIRVLDVLLETAMCDVENLPYGVLLKQKGVDKNSNLCLRCIGARRLEGLFNFLQNLCKTCRVAEYERVKPSLYDDSILFQNEEIKWAFLEPRPFTVSTNHWYDDEAHVDTEGIISWLYEGPATQDAIQSWVKSKDARVNLIRFLVEKLNVKCKRFSRHLKDRDFLNRYIDVLKKADDRWKKKKIEAGNPSTCLLYILTGWKKYLAKSQKEEDLLCMAAISQDFFEVAGEDSWNAAKTIAKAITECGKKLSVLDMKILKNMAYMRELLDTFEFVSGIDYLAGVVPMVKMFIQGEWEKAAETYAKRNAVNVAKTK